MGQAAGLAPVTVLRGVPVCFLLGSAPRGKSESVRRGSRPEGQAEFDGWVPSPSNLREMSMRTEDGKFSMHHGTSFKTEILGGDEASISFTFRNVHMTPPPAPAADVPLTPLGAI